MNSNNENDNKDLTTPNNVDSNNIPEDNYNENLASEPEVAEVPSDEEMYENSQYDAHNRFKNDFKTLGNFNANKEELKAKTNDAINQRNNKFKDSVDASGNAIKTEKSAFDKAKDTAGVGAAKGAEALNYINAAKAAKDIAENPEQAKEVAKDVAKTQIKKKIFEKLVAFIAENPYVLAVIAAIIAIIAVILLLVVIFVAINNDRNGNSLDTNNYACGSSVDSPISVTHTPLSRSQFIEALQNYSSSNSHYADLRDNAGLVYDLGVEYGINPELAVIRAELEGYSPGSNYNYWGIGCYNGAGSDGSCKGQYSSLENGLIAFYNTIKAYNTDNIYEVMSRYAYIGDNWYFPGSSSSGGCYYYPYIREYLSPTRDAQVGTSCEQGTEIATTEEDQLAYTKWQVDNGTMAKRLAIFNLGPDSIPVCESYDVDATPTPTSSEGILTSDDGTVETILAQHGSSIAQLNDKIKQNTLQKGIGSREAVAGAASILINTFDSYGYKLPYSYSGGWGGGYNDNPVVTSYYGVNPAIGTSINNGSGYTVQFDSGPTTYYYVGYDCSGFVAWALRNGGINHSVIGASAYRNDDGDVSHSACSTEYIGQPGDVLANAHHVILILSYNSADQTYTIAEAKGKSYGILSSTVPLSSLCSYDVVDMSSFYENSVNTNYEADFEAGRKG